MMRIAFRTDSSALIGTGHLMRCLTLADELARRGHEVLFVCRELEGSISVLVRERGHRCNMLPAPTAFSATMPVGEDAPGHSAWLGVSQDLDAMQTIAALGNTGPLEWLIVDHYALDAHWERALRGRCKRLMVIDDLADRPHECDLLLDQNLYLEMEHRYEGLLPGTCSSLLGPRFALLRPTFARKRRELRAQSGEVRRILVFFGGIDAENETMKALEAISHIDDARLTVDVVVGASNPHRETLQEYCADRPAIRLHVQTERIAELMRVADLAIGAGGVATWERCATGLPTIAWPLADNQRAVISAAADFGALCAAELTAVGSADDLQRHINALLHSSHLRRHIGMRAASLCDGHGTRRVAEVLAPIVVNLRNATICDCEHVYRWRNHPSIRLASVNSEPIPYETHKAWFERTLVDPSKALLIAEHDNSLEGVLRYDFEGNIAIVSLYLVPKRAGKGIGSAMLLAGESWLREKHPEIEQVQAVVLDANDSSKALFEKSGYLRRQVVYEKVCKK